MWLNKYLHRTIHSLAKYFKDSKKELYELGLIESLDSKHFENYNDNYGTLHTMILLYPNITQYIEKIIYCNTHLIEGLSIPNSWCKYNYSESNLSLFLRDNKRNNIDVVKFVEEFKLRTTIFLSEYDKSLKDENFTKRYNARVLSEFRAHLLDVMDVLIRSYVY